MRVSFFKTFLKKLKLKQRKRKVKGPKLKKKKRKYFNDTEILKNIIYDVNINLNEPQTNLRRDKS